MEIDPPSKHDTPVSCDGIHWSEWVAKMKSSHQSKEALLELCSEYGINKEEFMPFCAEEGCGPCMPPPEGSDAMCVVFEAMLEAGVRFPLHECYAKVLRHYSLAPSQLTPNAWRYLAGFVLLCEAAEVTPMAAVFRHYFTLKAHKGKLKGFYYFVPSTNRLLFKSIGTLPSNDGWKNKFFFLESRLPDQPWRCPKKWGTPSKAACRKPVVTETARTAINKLEEKTKKDDVMRLLYKSRDEDKLPVLSGLPAPVKLEASAAAEERALASRMEYKSLPAITNVQLVDVPTTSSPPEFALIPPGAEPGELSASQLMNACQLLQKTEAELNRVKGELRVVKAKHAGDIAQLDRDLVAAKANHTTKVAQLTEELQAEKIKHADGMRDLVVAEAKHKAEIARLAEELQVEKTKRAGEVADLMAAVVRLVEELETTKAQHLGKVRKFTGEIQAAETERDKALELANAHQAEVGQLKDELQARKAKYVADVGAVNAQMKVLKAAEAENSAKVREFTEELHFHQKNFTEEFQSYTNRAKAAMRKLTLAFHPGGVDTALLTADVLSGPVAPGSASPQAPGDQ